MPTVVLHKPRGYLSDRVEGRSAYDLLPEAFQGLGAIGRLDLETSGLLLFTSDPALNLRVRSSHVLKEYVATVGGNVPGQPFGLQPSALARFAEPLDAKVGGADVQVRRAYLLGHGGAAEQHWRLARELEGRGQHDAAAFDGWSCELTVSLREGKFHQVRRLVKRSGLCLRHLCRTRIGGVVAELQPGECRELTPAELDSLA